ncbi:MAG: hypothetical protein F6K35_36100 [Okeania sp. SIO2H7]|nr:hypothetical protein [Okeania sp. SIO2H7]
MNESEIIEQLPCLLCFQGKILFLPLPVYYTIDKTRNPWQQKVELFLFSKALIMKNSNGFSDYFYGIIRWQNLRAIVVKNQPGIGLFLLIAGLIFFLSCCLITLGTILGLNQFFPIENNFLILAVLFVNSLFVASLLILQLPKYCLHLKTDSELYVLTIKNSGDFATLKSFAEKVAVEIERSL